jgi:hypothetical protein
MSYSVLRKSTFLKEGMAFPKAEYYWNPDPEKGKYLPQNMKDGIWPLAPQDKYCPQKSAPERTIVNPDSANHELSRCPERRHMPLSCPAMTGHEHTSAIDTFRRICSRSESGLPNPTPRGINFLLTPSVDLLPLRNTERRTSLRRSHRKSLPSRPSCAPARIFGTAPLPEQTPPLLAGLAGGL